MKEENTTTEAVDTERETSQTASNCKCTKKISGDSRTFVIALLTAIIVVLIYHGIILGIRCIKNGCPREQGTSGQCQIPAPPQCTPAPCCHRHHDTPAPQHRQNPRFNHPGDRQNHHGQRQNGQHRQRRPRPQRPAPRPDQPQNAPTSQEPAE